MMPMCQSLLLTMRESTIIAQDAGRFPPSATMSIAAPFATSTNTSAHHARVGNPDSVSSMSDAIWEPAAVHIYKESKDFSMHCLDSGHKWSIKDWFGYYWC